MKPENKEKIEEVYDNLNNVASANEFTGLIPSPVETEFESESYTEDFDIQKQKKVEFVKNTEES